MSGEYAEVYPQHVVVPFVGEPYDIQTSLMQVLFKAMNERCVAFCESPTGTGKTRSLICSTLYWLFIHYPKYKTQLDRPGVVEQWNQALSLASIIPPNLPPLRYANYIPFTLLQLKDPSQQWLNTLREDGVVIQDAKHEDTLTMTMPSWFHEQSELTTTTPNRRDRSFHLELAIRQTIKDITADKADKIERERRRMPTAYHPIAFPHDSLLTDPLSMFDEDDSDFEERPTKPIPKRPRRSHYGIDFDAQEDDYGTLSTPIVRSSNSLQSSTPQNHPPASQRKKPTKSAATPVKSECNYEVPKYILNTDRSLRPAMYSMIYSFFYQHSPTLRDLRSKDRALTLDVVTCHRTRLNTISFLDTLLQRLMHHNQLAPDTKDDLYQIYSAILELTKMVSSQGADLFPHELHDDDHGAPSELPSHMGHLTPSAIVLLDSIIQVLARLNINTPKICYFARTHTQITQYLSEMEKVQQTKYHADPLYVVTLGSREQLCIHPMRETQNLHGKQLDTECTRLISSPDSNDAEDDESEHEERPQYEINTSLELTRQASTSTGHQLGGLYRRNRPSGVASENDNLNLPFASDRESSSNNKSNHPHGSTVNSALSTAIKQEHGVEESINDEKRHDSCPFFDQLDQAVYNEHLFTKVRDVEDSFRLGQQLQMCPYYGNRNAIYASNVVAGPYHYLVQRGSSKVPLKDNVVIVDEAHNLAKQIKDSNSSDIEFASIIFLLYGLLSIYHRPTNIFQFEHGKKMLMYLLKLVYAFYQRMFQDLECQKAISPPLDVSQSQQQGNQQQIIPKSTDLTISTILSSAELHNVNFLEIINWFRTQGRIFHIIGRVHQGFTTLPFINPSLSLEEVLKITSCDSPAAIAGALNDPSAESWSLVMEHNRHHLHLFDPRLATRTITKTVKEWLTTRYPDLSTRIWGVLSFLETVSLPDDDAVLIGQYCANFSMASPKYSRGTSPESLSWFTNLTKYSFFPFFQFNESVFQLCQYQSCVLDASTTFNTIANQARSVVLAAGTLGRFDLLQIELFKAPTNRYIFDLKKWKQYLLDNSCRDRDLFLSLLSRFRMDQPEKEWGSIAYDRPRVLPPAAPAQGTTSPHETLRVSTGQQEPTPTADISNEISLSLAFCNKTALIQFRCPHVVPPENVLTICLSRYKMAESFALFPMLSQAIGPASPLSQLRSTPSSPSQSLPSPMATLNFSARTASTEQLSAVCRLLKDVSPHTPGGIVVFFPSRLLLTKMMNYLQQQDQMEGDDEDPSLLRTDTMSMENISSSPAGYAETGDAEGALHSLSGNTQPMSTHGIVHPYTPPSSTTTPTPQTQNKAQPRRSLYQKRIAAKPTIQSPRRPSLFLDGSTPVRNATPSPAESEPLRHCLQPNPGSFAAHISRYKPIFCDSAGAKIDIIINEFKQCVSTPPPPNGWIPSLHRRSESNTNPGHGEMQSSQSTHQNDSPQNPRQPSGAILFCVMSGRLSEGIDFADDMCRMVVICGLPFSNPTVSIVKKQIEHANSLFTQYNLTLDRGMQYYAGFRAQHGDGGALYYIAQCMQAINQAIGRAIRSISDYASVILFDERFEKSHTPSLPLWLYNNESSFHYNAQEIAPLLIPFYRRMTQPKPGPTNDSV